MTISGLARKKKSGYIDKKQYSHSIEKKISFCLFRAISQYLVTLKEYLLKKLVYL